MNDQTPRVPDLWWDPTTMRLYRLFGSLTPGVVYDVQTAAELPADAVKLGDATVAEVREVEAERNAQELRAITAEAKLNEIREVLAVQRDGSIDDANFSIVESIRAILGRPAAAPAEPREEHRLTHSWGRQGLTISLSCTCGSWHRSDRRLSHGDLGEALKDWTGHAHGSVVEHREDKSCSCAKGYATCDSCRAKNYPPAVEHQPAQDSEPGVVTVDVEIDTSGFDRALGRALLEATRHQLELAVRQRDLALWLHAEAVHDRDEARAQRDEAMANGARHRDNHGDLGEALKDWTTHAHGSVVEHQPDPCKSCVAAGVCERPTAKDCIAVTRESVVEHQPAQDSEGDR